MAYFCNKASFHIIEAFLIYFGLKNSFFTFSECDLNIQNFKTIKIKMYVMIQRKCLTDMLWDHPFSAYAKFSEKLIFLTPCYAHVGVHING